MILIFSVNTNHESVAYRSFSPSKFEARGARKVTTGMSVVPRQAAGRKDQRSKSVRITGSASGSGNGDGHPNCPRQSRDDPVALGPSGLPNARKDAGPRALPQALRAMVRAFPALQRARSQELACGSQAFIATLLFDPSMSALPIIEKQNSPSVGLFTH